MDESVTKHFEQQQVGKLRLSEAIRIGCRTIRETVTSHRGCAIGIGYTALTGKNLTAVIWDGYPYSEQFTVYQMAVSDAFSMPIEIVRQAEFKHQFRNREQIADWLESKGW